MYPTLESSYPLSNLEADGLVLWKTLFQYKQGVLHLNIYMFLGGRAPSRRRIQAPQPCLHQRQRQQDLSAREVDFGAATSTRRSGGEESWAKENDEWQQHDPPQHLSGPQV